MSSGRPRSITGPIFCRKYQRHSGSVCSLKRAGVPHQPETSTRSVAERPGTPRSGADAVDGVACGDLAPFERSCRWTTCAASCGADTDRCRRGEHLEAVARQPRPRIADHIGPWPTAAGPMSSPSASEQVRCVSPMEPAPSGPELGGGRSGAWCDRRQEAVQPAAVGGVPVPMNPNDVVPLAASEPL